MEEFRGIVLYNIERDGDLNGVYSNNHPIINGRIFTETARLVSGNLVEGQTVEYDSFYFDAVEGRVNCTLTFTITDRSYEAEWRLLNGTVIFRGQGFRMSDRQIAISYWI